MYIGPDEYANTFRRLKESSMSHSTCRVVILVSCLDIDALCAAKMMAGLFKLDLIPHKIIPVVGYEELKATYQTLDDDVTNVICIGCGATVDLEGYLEITPDFQAEDDQNQNQNQNQEREKYANSTEKTIYIIDNHRPWNLDNLFGSQSVVCLDDGEVDHDMSKHKEAYRILMELGDMDLEEEDEDEDEDTEEQQEKEEEDGDAIVASDDEPNDDEEADIFKASSSPTSGQDPSLSEKENIDPQKDAKTTRKEIREIRDTNQELLEDHYAQGTYISASSTIVVYTLISFIGETSINFLWFTIVGVTSLDAEHSMIYSKLYPLLRDEVVRLCPTTPAGVNSSFHGSEAQLYIETDYLLFLLRNWSLYESMMHSSYLSAKLHLWTEDGKKKLHKMLAKMGISLQESREQWPHMNIMLKRSLKDKLKAVSGIYGIEKILRQGIIRKYGYKGSVSAGDCVDALAALLESGIEQNLYTKTALKDTTEEIEEEEQDGKDHETAGVDDVSTRNKFWVSNFWAGWDALENIDLLIAGITKAKALQSAVVSASTALFEKRQIKDLRTFRLAVVREGPDLEVFRNPLALARLGTWVAEACSEANTKPLPLVIASFDPKTATYLVLGMGPRKSRDVEIDPNITVFNKFGPAFQETTSRTNAQVTMNAFESSIIEVAKDDLSRFLETLSVSDIR